MHIRNEAGGTLCLPAPGHTLITGASQGVGRALADECARRGMDLVLVALPSSGLGEVAASIRRRHGTHVLYLEMDLAAPPSPERLARWIGRNGTPRLS